MVDPSLVHINAVLMRGTDEGGARVCFNLPGQCLIFLNSVPRCIVVVLYLLFFIFFPKPALLFFLFYNVLHNQKKLRVGTPHTSHTETTHALAA